MNIDWTARGASVPDTLQARVEGQLGKLDRFLRGHCEARVVVTQEGQDVGTSRRAIEVIVRHRLGTFAARDESRDLAESANTVLGRIEAQVRKAHDKLLNGRKKSESMLGSPDGVGAE